MEAPLPVEVSRIAKIGTSNFTEFLTGRSTTYSGDAIRADLDDFEKQIEVPEPVHQAIKEMYEQKREGSFASPASEERERQMAAQVDLLSPGLGEEFLKREKKNETLEQARVVFEDPQTGELGSTASTFGYGSEVSLFEPIQEAIGQGCLPVLPIHTHPRDANLSFDDYSLMLTGIGNNQHDRLMTSTMVLLPSMQILALATKDTPVFGNGQDLDKFKSSHHEEFRQNEILLMKQFIELMQKLAKRQDLIKMAEMVRSTLGEKHKDVVEQALSQYDIKGGESEELEQMMAAAQKKGTDASAKLINSALIAFGRELHVKLYFSLDMRNFKEFSA